MKLPLSRRLPAVICWMLLWTAGPVQAEFGDYADETFNCPARTTCPLVCVANLTDCPSEMMLCESPFEQLCLDGTCAESCDGIEESPCAYGCASVACAKVIDFYDSCKSKYAPFYEAEATCGALEVAETVHLYTYTEPVFVFFYVWYAICPLILFAWCAYNQRMSPVSGSCQTLDLETVMVDRQGGGGGGGASSKQPKKPNARIAWQTGYKIHPIGFMVSILTYLTIVAVYFTLCWLIIQYYVQQEAIRWSFTKAHFEDEGQVLLCFIVLWMAGFLWMFSLKFPHSIYSVHLRRCVLRDANYVAIAVKRLEVGTTEVVKHNSQEYFAGIKTFFASFYDVVHSVMTFVFSDAHTFGCERKGEDATFCMRPVEVDAKDGTRYFTFEFRRYSLKEPSTTTTAIADQDTIKFVPGDCNMTGKTIGDICMMDNGKGLSEDQIQLKTRILGKNKIEMIPPRFLRALKDVCTAPFYTYQIFMVLSWFPFWYYYMALTWLSVICMGALTVSLLHHKNAASLYRLAHVSGEVEVIRGGKKVTFSQDELVPGDILTVLPGLAYCDMILVDSTRLLVDESALTGEANPIGKSSLDRTLPKEGYNDKTHKKSTIFAGTTILEADNARAIVSSTGSYTARGELIRDIFAYRRQKFKFDSEVPIVVTILFFVGCIGWGLAYNWTGEVFVYGWFYGIYVLAACLPPLLPTVFTVSVGVSDSRLAKKRITCTNSESILVAGKVTRAFFDKTGTLTKQGLDFIAARGKSAWVEGDDGYSAELDMQLTTDELKLGMACCHGLTPSSSGELIGNPVDRVLFATSKAKMDFTPSNRGGHMKITDANGKTVVVVKHFDFDHHTMTQSVIIRHEDSGVLVAFCKGSGESIQERCIPETLPRNFDHALRQSAKAGLYQISMAAKVLSTTGNDDVSQFKRQDVESNLTFQGVINFKNILRENAPGVIQTLEGGDVISTMITGDNVLTGIRIAREAGILKSIKPVYVGEIESGSLVWRAESGQLVELLASPEEEQTDATETGSDHMTDMPVYHATAINFQLAMSGAAWRQWQVMDPKRALRFQDAIRVFGRCNPYDKVSIVQGSALTGHITLMTGDGGNDCGALKAAHVGIALSDAEASIVAPFTSLDKDIGSVVDVLLEGRCALGSSLASYKFIILYGQTGTMLQIIAAYFGVTYPQPAWIFTDGIWPVTLSFALPLAKAATTLAPNRPTASILGIFTLASSIGVYCINFMYLVIGYVYLNHQDWYKCRKWVPDDLSNILVLGDNFETAVLFSICGFQIFGSAIIYNFGYEFRQAWYKNYTLVFLISVFVFIHFYAVSTSGKLSCLWRLNCVNENTFSNFQGQMPIQNPFNTTVMPEEFRRGLIGIMVANLCTTVGWDYFVVNGTRQYHAAKRRRERNTGNNTETKLVTGGKEESGV